MSRMKYVLKNHLLFFLSVGHQVIELCLIGINVSDNNFKGSSISFSLVEMAGYSPSRLFLYFKIGSPNKNKAMNIWSASRNNPLACVPGRSVCTQANVTDQF